VRIRRLTVAIVVVSIAFGTSGCMSVAKALAGHPVAGYGIDQDLADWMRCDLEETKRRGEEFKQQSYASGGRGYLVPSVGDSGCDVLAKLGRPDDIRSVSTENDTYFNLLYHTGSTQTYDYKAHQVTLVMNQMLNGLVATSVVW